MQQKVKENSIKVYLFSPLIVLIIVLCVYVLEGYAPFGNKSLMADDAHIQYRYFFGYLKDILEGKNDIFYSFSIGLGQTGFGVTNYYLMSPLNLLIIFFEKSNIDTFFDIIVALKLAIASMTMTFYLRKRFRNRLKMQITVLLSASWGLMQYSIEQCDNIMWLDGVIMLPLILWGVYKVIAQRKTVFLSMTVAASIILQWYTAGINCIFAIGWFLLELLLWEDGENKKAYLSRTGKFILSMATGVLISAVTFLPSILALRTGKGGSFDWNIISAALRGNILSSISNYSIGALSSSSSVALYAGSIVILGCFGLLLSRYDKKKKGILLGLLFISVMLFYWQPFFVLFSLFKSADSYWYRYSYIAVFSFVFVAACFYIDLEDHSAAVLHGGFLLSCVLMIANTITKDQNDNDIYLTVSFVICTCGLLFLLYYLTDRRKVLVWIALFGLFFGEQMINIKDVFYVNRYEGVDTYRDYTLQFESQLEAIHQYDTGHYRLSTTFPWILTKDNKTASYSEFLGEGESGIASYTSCPDYTYMRLLDHMGYRIEGGCLQVINTSIVPTDSLFSAKYIICPYDIPGYNLIPELPEVYGKKVYENPYALPEMLKYTPSGTDLSYNGNPFEYTNLLYEELSETRDEVFYPIDIQREETDTGVRWKFTGVEPDGLLYGNILWDYDSYQILDINAQISQAYTGWLSPSAFYIPHSKENGYFELKTNKKDRYQKAQVYACDLEKLGQLTRELQKGQGAISEAVIQNGYIHAKVSAQEGEHLWMSVPANNGWKAYRNGERIELTRFADALIDLPLLNGENEIVIRYEVPGLKKGIALTLFGCCLLIAISLIDAKRQRK